MITQTSLSLNNFIAGKFKSPSGFFLNENNCFPLANSFVIAVKVSPASIQNIWSFVRFYYCHCLPFGYHFTERDVNAKLHSKLRSINIAQNQLTTEQMSREDIRTRASIPNVRPVRLVRLTPPPPIARHLQSGKVSPRLDETIFYYLFLEFPFVWGLPVRIIHHENS